MPPNTMARMTTSANAYQRRALGFRGADVVAGSGAISDMIPNHCTVAGHTPVYAMALSEAYNAS